MVAVAEVEKVMVVLTRVRRGRGMIISRLLDCFGGDDSEDLYVFLSRSCHNHRRIEAVMICDHSRIGGYRANYTWEHLADLCTFSCQQKSRSIIAITSFESKMKSD